MYDDIDKAYVSPFDKVLFNFDVTHAKSASQIKEIAKHKRIAALRDTNENRAVSEKIWEGF